jgi:hypothetical protein
VASGIWPNTGAILLTPTTPVDITTKSTKKDP